jgi:hypothetical protein
VAPETGRSRHGEELLANPKNSGVALPRQAGAQVKFAGGALVQGAGGALPSPLVGRVRPRQE